MSNWLADPTDCMARFKKSEGGCIILAGRNEVMSRSTTVYREVTDEGTRKERTTWSSGHVEVYRDGPDQRRDMGKANLNLRYWLNDNQASTIGPLLPTEATLMSDILRAAAVSAGGSACGGRTILELLWDEMMVVYERLVTDQAAEHDVGIAQGIAYAIAVMQNPYLPNIDNVRAQAAQKWEEDQ